MLHVHASCYMFTVGTCHVHVHVHLSCSCSSFFLHIHASCYMSHGRIANAVSHFSGSSFSCSILVLPMAYWRATAVTTCCADPLLFALLAHVFSIHVHLSSFMLHVHAFQVRGCKRLRPDSDDDGGGHPRPDCHDCLSSFWSACMFHGRTDGMHMFNFQATCSCFVLPVSRSCSR